MGGSIQAAFAILFGCTTLEEIDNIRGLSFDFSFDNLFSGSTILKGLTNVTKAVLQGGVDFRKLANIALSYSQSITEPTLMVFLPLEVGYQLFLGAEFSVVRAEDYDISKWED